jgi:hypothetical protein
LAKKVTIFTLFPLIFSIVVFSYTEFSKGSLIFIGGTLFPYFVFNLFLDFTNKSTKSRKARGYSGYFAFILTSIYLMVPAYLTIQSLIIIIIWLLLSIGSFIFRETIIAILLSETRNYSAIKVGYWASAAVVLLLGGGGYYPATKKIITNFGENASAIYFSFIFLFFSYWFLIFAQGTIAKFTKYEN